MKATEGANFHYNAKALLIDLRAMVEFHRHLYAGGLLSDTRQFITQLR
jgi:hypothetical protein